MKMIPKDALVAEIEKCINRCNEKKRSCPVNTQVEAICDIKINAYNEIVSCLNALEVKEVDLKDEASIRDELLKYLGSYSSRDFAVAKHFFELGLKAQKGEEV